MEASVKRDNTDRTDHFSVFGENHVTVAGVLFIHKGRLPEDDLR